MKDKEKLILETFHKNSTKSYKGRMLGLLDSEEFVKLMDSDTIARRIFTKESISTNTIKDIDVNGKRLCFAAHSISRGDGESQTPSLTCKKILFISEVLDMIQHYSGDERVGFRVGFSTKNGNWFSIGVDNE